MTTYYKVTDEGGRSTCPSTASSPAKRWVRTIT